MMPAMSQPAPLLLDLFRPVIDRGLALATEATRAPPSARAQDVNHEIFQALRAARDQARAAGKPDGPVLAASFAIAAWIDDALSAHTKWYGETPRLTQALFKTDDGITGTVERLRALPDSETDARSVIVMVIALGLGERRPDQAARLDVVRRQEAGTLARALGLTEAGLTPQPGGVSGPPPLPQPRAPRRLAVPVGLAALVALAAWPVAAVWQGGATRMAPDAALSGVDPLASLIAETYDCAQVTARLDVSGAVVVDGFAQSAADRDGIVSAIAALPDLAADRVEIAVLPWPFCDVAGTVAGLATPTAPDAPQIAVRSTTGTLARGDNLVVDLILDPATAGYLYVDLIDPDGRVIHLLPEPTRPDNILGGATEVTIGTTDPRPDPLRRRWTVADPPGQRMVLALIAPVPLFETLRPGDEPAAEYLNALTAALREIPDLGGGDVFPAGYTVFEVVP